jgi:hypothetical protein
MSAEQVIDAVLRLTGEHLPVGESVLATRLPDGKMQIIRLRLISSKMDHDDNHVRISEAAPYQFSRPVHAVMRFEAHLIE